MVWILIVSLLICVDQMTKALVISAIGPWERIPVIKGFFYLVNRTNTGGAWSLFAGFDWSILVLSILSGVACLVIAVLMVRWKSTPMRVCLSVILAGSAGNLIDRAVYSGVTDFLSFRFFGYEFPTFNFADMLLVCGTIVMILLLLIHPAWLSSIGGHRHPVDPE
ncbi:MAG: signal peptidase II [Clostridia bacterium]|nr:signal peptidase II [Clostridia bacterium]